MKTYIDEDAFSYVNEILEEDIKLTELESPKESSIKSEYQLHWPV